MLTAPRRDQSACLQAGLRIRAPLCVPALPKAEPCRFQEERERESRTVVSGVDDVMAGPDGLLFFMAFLSEAFFFKIIIN